MVWVTGYNWALEHISDTPFSTHRLNECISSKSNQM